MRFETENAASFRHALCGVLSLLFLILPAVRAEKLPFKNYTTTDGLAHDRVNRIIRDSRGFLWFCTSEGLSRFDGYEFKNYTQDDGLPHRGVSDFLETRDGQFWISTGDGLVLFNPQGSTAPAAPEEAMFRVFRPAQLPADSKVWIVKKLFEDSRGRIWIASVQGLYLLEKESFSLKRGDRDEWSLASNDFSALMEDSTGALWLGTERGLARLLPDESLQIVDPALRVGSLLEDRAGRIWVGSAGGESEGLYQYVLKDNRPQLVRVFGQKDGLAADHWMNALFETSDGRIYVGVGNGLAQFAPTDDAAAPVFRTISSQGIVSLGEDISGNLWLGTGSNGAFRLSNRGFTTFDEKDGLQSPRIASIFVSPDGAIYVMAGQSVIHRFEGGKFTAVSPLRMTEANWGTNFVAFQDRAGEWWIPGTAGLQRYPKVARLEDLATTEPKRLYTTSDGLESNSVFQLFEDSRGDIWIGLLEAQKNALMRFERATETFHHYTFADDPLLVNSCPTAFAEDRQGNLWFGFYTGGFLRYRNGRFENFSARLARQTGLIRDMHVDRSGRLWIATNAGGVIRIDDPAAETPALEVLSTKEGLISNQTQCVTEDRFGRIYVGTGRGISQLNLQNGRIKSFTTSDGLPENLISVCNADAAGNLLFGTFHGVARYTPTADETLRPPPIFIGGVRANGVQVRKISELGESSLDDLELATEQRQIQIDYLALGFAAGENLSYQYRLGDGEWSAPNAQRTINLGLSPGNYRLEIRAVNADGLASERPARVSFSIARPFWQHWWFLLLVALAMSGVVYLFFRYRVRRLLELERVRTRIATDLHDDIGSSLSQIAILSEVARQKMGVSAASEPLHLIADTSREMVDAMSDIVWAINPQKDYLSELIQRMRRFAEDMLNAQDIAYQFVVPENSKNIAVGADLRREVYLIFKECVNNLVKHAAATEAVFEIRLANEHLIVEIRDNGRGFDQERLLHESFVPGLGGNGLTNMARRASNLGGTFEIESEPEKGTHVALHVPLEQKRGKN